MKQSELQRLLANYADGEVDAQVRADISLHLKGHPEDREAVRRWRGLRRAAHRALNSEAVPAELSKRVRGRLRGAPQNPVARIYRLGFPGMAAAAAVLLAVWIWPQGAAATSVEANYFARHHYESALKIHRDSLDTRHGMSYEDFVALQRGADRAAIWQNASFRCAVPDLEWCDYVLHGASEYVPANRAHVVHAYFRCKSAGGAVLSMFVIDRCVRVCQDGKNACRCSHGERAYHKAQARGINIISWHENGKTYVLCCGIAEPDELVELADGIDRGQLADPRPAHVASSGNN